MSDVNSFKSRAEQYQRISDTLAKIPVSEQTVGMRVALLRERLKLFPDIAEWYIFKTTLLAGEPLRVWHMNWLATEEREYGMQNPPENPIRCFIEYGSRHFMAPQYAPEIIEAI